MTTLAATWLFLVLAVLAPVPAGASGGHPAMVDALGVVLPAGTWPRRIVSLSPSVTEVLFALGVAPERIAGVTRFCDYPPEARTRPQIGGIVDPSLEAILVARPDLVLAVRGTPIDLVERMRSLGLAVFAIDDRVGLEDIEGILSQVAELVGPDEPERARSLLRAYHEGIPRFRAWSDSIPNDARPLVLYCDPTHPGWSAGPGSHIDDLIRLAGGRNVITDGLAWPQISAERLMLLSPELLLLAWSEGSDRETARGALARHPGWRRAEALREGRMCWIDAGILLRPGPRMLGALFELAGCLHPERALPTLPAHVDGK